MSSQARPPLEGMAQEVLARGRRARRARTAKIASILVVAGSLVGVAVAMPTIAGSHSVSTAHPQASPTSAANAGPGTILLAAASPINYIPQPPGPKATTSDAAVLDELLKLLPPGATSHHALFTLGARTYLAGASGLGMIDVYLFPGSLNQDACPSAHYSDAYLTCGSLPDGAPVYILKNPGNCVQSVSILVDHGHGTVVQMDLATCLAWNGKSNPPAPMAITVAQAERIAANPAWGVAEMDAALVHDATTRFADVPEG